MQQRQTRSKRFSSSVDIRSLSWKCAFSNVVIREGITCKDAKVRKDVSETLESGAFAGYQDRMRTVPTHVEGRTSAIGRTVRITPHRLPGHHAPPTTWTRHMVIRSPSILGNLHKPYTFRFINGTQCKYCTPTKSFKSSEKIGLKKKNGKKILLPWVRIF